MTSQDCPPAADKHDMRSHPHDNGPIDEDATAALVFDAKAWQAHGGDDADGNRQFWRPAHIVERTTASDGTATATVQFEHDGRLSRGHIIDAMRAVRADGYMPTLAPAVT